MSMLGISGISTAVLNAVQDESTRQVLQALVDGWHVRNGVTGKGDNRFVTVGELGTVSGYRMIGGLKESVQEEVAKKPGITPGELSRVIADLQASIMESALWKDLGQRVNIIEAGGGAGMTEERTQRTNDDNALITAINTMWATIGDNSALVQRGQSGVTNNAGAVASAWQQVQSTIKDPVTGAYISSAAVRTDAQTAVNKAGDLEGKYTIKIDVNGHVSGFGLASTANNSTPSSRFIVRADQFAVGAPSMPDYVAYVNADSDILAAWNAAGQPDKRDYGYNHYVTLGQSEGRVVPNAIQEIIPFIVTTTPQTVNGRVVPPGVYMDSAFIKNGSITNADIGLAQIDTLVIQGNAVTVTTYDDAYLPYFTLTTTPTLLCSAQVSIPVLPSGATAGTIIIASATLYEQGSAATTVALEVLLNGVQIGAAGCTLGESKTITATAFADLPARQSPHVITTRLFVDTNSGVWPSATDIVAIGSMVIMSGKR